LQAHWPGPACEYSHAAALALATGSKGEEAANGVVAHVDGRNWNRPSALEDVLTAAGL
jgi:hypothetical protein